MSEAFKLAADQLGASRHNGYARDGKCHNANNGTMGHECGKAAVWLGGRPVGGPAGHSTLDFHEPKWHWSGYCDKCKQTGDEAKHVKRWVKVQEQDGEQSIRQEEYKQLTGQGEGQSPEPARVNAEQRNGNSAVAWWSAVQRGGK